MTTSTKLYTPQALKDLQERTEYETLLLETVYEEKNQHPKTGQLIYPKNDDKAKYVGIMGYSIIYVGNWRVGFKKECAPLVFVTAFKLFDMLMEWVLVRNKLKKECGSFDKKIKAVKPSTVRFPDFIESRSWLRERFIALYEMFKPVRNTIIHKCGYKSDDGILEVSSIKVGTAVKFTELELCNIVHVLIPVIRAIESGKPLDTYQEKLLHYRLDTLTQFHNLPALGQLQPTLFKVGFYDSGAEQFEFDISKIEKDIAENCKDYDVLSFEALLI